MVATYLREQGAIYSAISSQVRMGGGARERVWVRRGDEEEGMRRRGRKGGNKEEGMRRREARCFFRALQSVSQYCVAVSKTILLVGILLL